MIISVGFSVDIPAHVSYHYYQVKSAKFLIRKEVLIFQASIQEGPLSTPSDRLANCLSSVAFPAVQAALSTMLCVSSLLFVNLYMAEVHFWSYINFKANFYRSLSKRWFYAWSSATCTVWSSCRRFWSFWILSDGLVDRREQRRRDPDPTQHRNPVPVNEENRGSQLR